MATQQEKDLQKQIAIQQGQYNKYAPQFADSVLADTGTARNAAGAMFQPEQYWGSQDAFRGSQNNANADIDKFGQNADFLWDNPGYTGQEKQAMDTAAAAPIQGSYSAAGQELRDASARTGNSAALGANITGLAHAKGRDLALAGLNNQSLFADARIKGQQAALTAQGQVPGMHNAQAGLELQNQGTLQNAVNLGLEPARINMGGFGTSQQGQSSTTAAQGQSAQLSKQPNFLKQLALAGASGASSVATKAAMA